MALRTRFIPENVMQGKRFLGMRKRNLIEGCSCAIVAAILIGFIPFVPTVRWIITLCVGMFLILLNGIGIKGRSFSQVLLNLREYKKVKHNYSYRRLNYADKEPQPVFETINGQVTVKTIKDNAAINKAKHIFGR